MWQREKQQPLRQKKWKQQNKLTDTKGEAAPGTEAETIATDEATRVAAKVTAAADAARIVEEAAKFIDYPYDYTCRQSMVRNKMFRKQLFRMFALPYLLIQYL